MYTRMSRGSTRINTCTMHIIRTNMISAGTARNFTDILIGAKPEPINIRISRTFIIGTGIEPRSANARYSASAGKVSWNRVV